MTYKSGSVRIATATTIALGLGSMTVSAQATIDLANRYSNVGVIMVWRIDDSGKPAELRGFASGTLIRDRVMVTAGHFTAPANTLGSLPPSIRIFASFSPTDAKDPKTWIPVVRQATHPSMPHCPPPPQCDPTDELLVAPLEPGIADVGLVFLAHAPPGIKPARFAAPGTLDRSEGAQMTIVGYGTTTPRRNAPPGTAIRDVGRKAAHQDFDTAKSRRPDLGALVHTQLRLLGRLRWRHFSESQSKLWPMRTCWPPT